VEFLLTATAAVLKRGSKEGYYFQVVTPFRAAPPPIDEAQRVPRLLTGRKWLWKVRITLLVDYLPEVPTHLDVPSTDHLHLRQNHPNESSNDPHHPHLPAHLHSCIRRRRRPRKCRQRRSKRWRRRRKCDGERRGPRHVRRHRSENIDRRRKDADWDRGPYRLEQVVLAVVFNSGVGFSGDAFLAGDAAPALTAGDGAEVLARGKLVRGMEGGGECRKEEGEEWEWLHFFFGAFGWVRTTLMELKREYAFT
jgi:hypothetical protein